MGKLKTKKSIVKRFKLSKGGKLMQRTCGQGHFNSREPGKVTRAKRRDHQISKVFRRTIKKAMPF